MILAELIRFHRSGPFERSTPEGFEWKKIPFVLILDTAGRLQAIEDTRNAEGMVKKFLVPAGAKRTKGISANLLWDTAEYVLGSSRDGKTERAAARHDAFKANLRKINQRDLGVKAVLRFLEDIPWCEMKRLQGWSEILASNAVLSFRLQSDEVLVCARPAVVKSINRVRGKSKLLEGTRGVCLVTGEEETFETVHPWILGVHGTEQGRGRLISFGQRAFDSYGSEGAGSPRAPIGTSASHSYAAALNFLLAPQSRHRIQLGDLTVVFWAEKACGFESVFARYAGSPWEEGPQEPDEWLRSLRRYSHGRHRNARFFVLGLAGYGSRIAIALWVSERIGCVADAIINHCQDQFLRSAARTESFVSLSEGLDALARRAAGNQVPDGLGAAVLRAQILGHSYPRAAYSRLLLNVSNRGLVDYSSAALIRAYVNRAVAGGTIPGAQLPATIDPRVSDLGYLWGRYFALCEFIDRRTSPRWAPSLGSRFYKVASVRPAPWRESFYRRAKSRLLGIRSQMGISELESELDSVNEAIRSHDWRQENLSEEDQGRFAVGYFQQRQELSLFRMSNGPDQASL